MTMTAPYMRKALHILLALMWSPMPVWAASIAAQDAFGAVEWPVFALAFGLSTLSGATALVWRLDKELRASPDGSLPRPWLFAASNLLGSWTAGALAWVGAQGQGSGVWSTLGAVILLSFGGARVIEIMVEKYTKREGGPQ